VGMPLGYQKKDKELDIIVGWRPVIINDNRPGVTPAKELFLREAFFTSVKSINNQDMIDF